MNIELKELILSIDELPNIKRLKELEPIIDDNKKILVLGEELKNIQKNLINAKYHKDKDMIDYYSKEVIRVNNELSNEPFYDEYRELLEEAYLLLKNISKTIETELNK